MAHSRLFTLQEASSLLPRLIPLIDGLREAKQELDAIVASLGAIAHVTQGNGNIRDALSTQDSAEDRVRELQSRIQVGLEEIQALGCLVKDLDLGLVDFPSLREGEVVYLCWRLGEESIGFWHDLDSGFAGRRPLEQERL
jgi:hypothetical protein